MDKEFKKQVKKLNKIVHKDGRIEILLLRSDFKGNCFIDVNDCPVARAVKRAFNLRGYEISVSPDEVETPSKQYKIKGDFNCDDYDYIKQQYKKHPDKDRYYVTLTPTKHYL